MLTQADFTFQPLLAGGRVAVDDQLGPALLISRARPTTLFSRVITEDVGSDLYQPGLQATVLAPPVPIACCPEKGLLCKILGLVLVTTTSGQEAEDGRALLLEVTPA